jgi:hypothetical protein
MRTLVPTTLLRSALVLDALGSGPVAVLHLVGGAALAQRTGIPADLLHGTGLFMVAYVALLVLLATRPRLPAPLIGFVVVGNTAWALGALGLGLGAGWPLSGEGIALVAVHGVAVLLFAALQYVGLRQSQGAVHGRMAAAT